MIFIKISAVVALINWLVTVNSAGRVSITFAETRPGMIPNGGVTQIATVSTPSAIDCARLCWENLKSTGCRGIVFQPNTCSGNKYKPSSPGLCQMLGFSETTPLTFGKEDQSTCQKFYSLPLANCSIVAQSFGYGGGQEACDGPALNNQFGYVILNGEMSFNMSFCVNIPTMNGSPRGVILMTVDPLSCKILNLQTYDTCSHGEDAVSLANALKTAPNGTLFVAVTADEPQGQISTAVSTLMTTCNVNITNLRYRGSFAFVCVAGCPEKTKWQLQPPHVPGANVSATVIGTPTGTSLILV